MNRPVRPLPRPPRVSDPAPRNRTASGVRGESPPNRSPRGGLSFQTERFSLVSRELRPLLADTWREAPWRPETQPLDFDWDRYFSLDVLGVLSLLTARNSDKFRQTPTTARNSDKLRQTPTLVGYVLSLVSPHPHYCSTPFASVDSFYLHPDYRTGWNGVRMLRENEAKLREIGVKVVHCGHNVRWQPRRMQKLLTRLGYEPIEIAYAKSLD